MKNWRKVVLDREVSVCEGFKGRVFCVGGVGGSLDVLL